MKRKPDEKEIQIMATAEALAEKVGPQVVKALGASLYKSLKEPGDGATRDEIEDSPEFLRLFEVGWTSFIDHLNIWIND